MQQKEAEIVSVFVQSKLKHLFAIILKLFGVRKEIKPLIK